MDHRRAVRGERRSWSRCHVVIVVEELNLFTAGWLNSSLVAFHIMDHYFSADQEIVWDREHIARGHKRHQLKCFLLILFSDGF